jgi:hypothetical protein
MAPALEHQIERLSKPSASAATSVELAHRVAGDQRRLHPGQALLQDANAAPNAPGAPAAC